MQHISYVNDLKRYNIYIYEELYINYALDGKLINDNFIHQISWIIVDLKHQNKFRILSIWSESYISTMNSVMTILPWD